MALPVYAPGTASVYCRTHGVKHKTSGDELNLQTCPLCGKNDFKFYLNDQTGQFVCHHASCNAKGGWYRFRQLTGEIAPVKPLAQDPKPISTKRYALDAFVPFEQALATDPDGLAYLATRGITPETAQAWHWGLKIEGTLKWLMFPYISAGGEILDCKYRTLPPAEKRFKRMGGGESVLYGEQFFGGVTRPPRLFLCEGEADCVSLWQQGFTPVVSTTTGAGSFKPRWHDLIMRLDPQEVVVVYDSDVAGQEGAKHVVRKFDDRKVINVILPNAKDANEYFLTHTAADFETLVAESQPVESERVRSSTTVLDMLEEQLFLTAQGCDGYPSQFDELNAMIAGGFWKGTVTTISGVAGAGKTTLLLNLLDHQVEQGHPAYFLCLEMPETMMMRKWIEHRYHVPMHQITLADVQHHRRDLESLPLYFGYKGGAWDEIETAVRNAVKRYDLRLFAFDNINFLARDPNNVTHEIGIVTKRLKELAVDLQLAIFLIAQPMKFKDDERMMTLNDLKDASAIAQDADTVMLLWRQRRQSSITKDGQVQWANAQSSHSPYAILRVDKARYSSGGEIVLYFDGGISTYRTLTEEEKAALESKKGSV